MDNTATMAKRRGKRRCKYGVNKNNGNCLKQKRSRRR